MAKLSKSNQQLRIIGGRYRGRKLSFPEVDGLRPTPDRVRETVFNWLQAKVGGAHCLDLFAGSGALGFEAASRGAKLITFVENNTQAAQQLKVNSQLLNTQNCVIAHQSAQQFIANQSEQYDIIFIDPPYSANLWEEIAKLLVKHVILVDNGLVYIECPSKSDLPKLPKHWQLIKDKKAGEVRYCLFQNSIGDSA